MTIYATVADVTRQWDGDADEDRIEAYLEDAHTLLNDNVPDLDARVADPTRRPSAAMVKIVICRVVERKLDNPKGYQGEHAGDVGYYYGTNAAVPGQLGFTKADLAQLGLRQALPPASTIPVGVASYLIPQQRRPL